MSSENNCVSGASVRAVAMILLLMPIASARPQTPLRAKIGQMIMVTVTGDSVESNTESMDTLKTDLSDDLIGGVIMFTWSDNLNNPAQIANLTAALQSRAHVPLFLAVDEEGGLVARLNANNGFASTPSAYAMGTTVNQESYTRSTASTMAGWFVQTGLNMNLAPVVDLNINPSSPAIGGLNRSFSADPARVASHALWFIDEFHKRNLLTVLKHFPGHGSAVNDSHLGFTDVTQTWSPVELQPYSSLLAAGSVDAVMTGHLYNATIDSLYPATLSTSTITGILRGQIGYEGLVISDEMSMKAISSLYGMEQAVELAINAGVDILLYNRNLDSAGNSLARTIVAFVEQKVQEGAISETKINESFARIMALKSRFTTDIAPSYSSAVPADFALSGYPNPFNASTTLRFSLPVKSGVVLSIYDLLGRLVERVAGEEFSAGPHEVRWDAGRFSSGVYLCRIDARAADGSSWGEGRTLRLIMLK